MEPIQDDQKCPTCGHSRGAQEGDAAPLPYCDDPFHVEPIQDDIPFQGMGGGPIQDDPVQTLRAALDALESYSGDQGVEFTVDYERAALDRLVAKYIEADQERNMLLSEREMTKLAMEVDRRNYEELVAERDRLTNAITTIETRLTEALVKFAPEKAEHPATSFGPFAAGFIKAVRDELEALGDG